MFGFTASWNLRSLNNYCETGYVLFAQEAFSESLITTVKLSVETIAITYGSSTMPLCERNFLLTDFVFDLHALGVHFIKCPLSIPLVDYAHDATRSVQPTECQRSHLPTEPIPTIVRNVIMAHRHIYSTAEVFEAEPDQHWNRLNTEDPHLHFARVAATENGPIFHPGENGSVDRAHYASQWAPVARLNGYSSSSQLVNAPHYQPDASDPSRDSLHQSAAGNVFMAPENHIHHASSSNYGVESNFFDLSMGSGRGPYKRKSPGIPPISERGSTSRYYCSGSSSNVSSSSDLRQEKSTIDAQHAHWESLPVPASFRGSQLSIGIENPQRNVRSRSALDESDIFRNHVPASYSHHPSSSRLPVDHSGTADHLNQNPSAPLREWNPIHLPASHGRTMVPSGLTHESNHFFPGNSVTNAPGEMAGYHHEHISSRNSVVPQSLHPTPSHTRGVRSSYTHRSSPNNRVSLGSLRMGHIAPSDEGMHVVGESHSSRHSRSFGPVGWRNGDRSGRSRLSSERYRFLSDDVGAHDRLTPEGLMIVDRSLYGSRNLFDQHRDMRLDVDNMSYEELLALGERIGSVSTGVGEDKLPNCLTETVYCSSDQVQEEGRCVICLEDYQHMDDVGTLKACGHDYHVSCIKKWLSMKNTCPVCKGPAVPDKKDK